MVWTCHYYWIGSSLHYSIMDSYLWWESFLGYKLCRFPVKLHDRSVRAWIGDFICSADHSRAWKQTTYLCLADTLLSLQLRVIATPLVPLEGLWHANNISSKNIVSNLELITCLLHIMTSCLWASFFGAFVAIKIVLKDNTETELHIHRGMKRETGKLLTFE